MTTREEYQAATDLKKLQELRDETRLRLRWVAKGYAGAVEGNAELRGLNEAAYSLQKLHIEAEVLDKAWELASFYDAENPSWTQAQVVTTVVLQLTSAVAVPSGWFETDPYTTSVVLRVIKKLING